MFRICINVIVFSLLVVAGVAFADNDKSGAKGTSGDRQSVRKPDSARPVKRKEVPALIPEREAAALAFARKYHADLEHLLVFLKENNPNAYRQAVYELYRTSQRLAMFHDRGDKERYKLELQLWQTQSRSQLIIARMKMTSTGDLEKQLKETLIEQLELRTKILERDRTRTAERLEKLDDQIDRLTKDREREIQRQIDLLTRSPKIKKGSSLPRNSKQPKALDKSRPKKATP